jgi:hypothetical protein
MAALIPSGIAGRKERRLSGIVLLGVDLQDAREEIFVRMVCDGMALGVAFKRAGFTSKDVAAPSKLFALPRLQARANAILEARRTQGVVTLPQVTDMLQRVFTEALHSEQLSAAHNAAFSLARLYGHVTDKATLEVIRKPSRDPDAPAEQALSKWIDAIPGPGGFTVPGLVLPGSVSELCQGPECAPQSLEGPSPASPAADASGGPQPHAPAAPLGRDPNPGPESLNDIKHLDQSGPSGLEASAAGPGPHEREKPNEINWLAGTAGVVSENGAPARPVTGTPSPGGRTKPLGPSGPRGAKTTPRKKKRVPVKKREKPKIPSAKDLFG